MTKTGITMAEVRALYPRPVRYADAFKPAPEWGGRLKFDSACYCVGGALTLAHEARAGLDGHDADIVESRFPTEIAGTLETENPALGGNLPEWADGNGSMGVVYESAITAANDHTTICLDDADADTVEEVADHFELAWQLLDDALRFDPAAHRGDRAAQLRLARGVLLGVTNDADYTDPDRPELVAYRDRHVARYRTLIIPE